MKAEALGKRAGAYWPINSPKCCCCIPSIPHFVSEDLSYCFGIDLFCQIAGHFLQVQYVRETEKAISRSVRKKAISGALIVLPCLTFSRCHNNRLTTAWSLQQTCILLQYAALTYNCRILHNQRLMFLDIHL